MYLMFSILELLILELGPSVFVRLISAFLLSFPVHPGFGSVVYKLSVPVILPCDLVLGYLVFESVGVVLVVVVVRFGRGVIGLVVIGLAVVQVQLVLVVAVAVVTVVFVLIWVLIVVVRHVG
jgi:hypothetical protein